MRIYVIHCLLFIFLCAYCLHMPPTEDIVQQRFVDEEDLVKYYCADEVHYGDPYPFHNYF